MTIGKEGGVIESQILDAYVEIPKNALERDVEVEVRRAEPQTVPPFYCTLGEVIEGDYFEVRPIGLEFEKPAILTLPQSYAQIPNLCHVCVKRYDKDKKEWVDAPLCPAEGSIQFLLQFCVVLLPLLTKNMFRFFSFWINLQ